MEPRWWRWSLVDDDAAWRCSDIALCLHALMIPYVFIVFIDACGWIPCHMMPWSHGSCSWWRWHALMWWLLDEFRPCCWWHDHMMEMTLPGSLDGDNIHDALVVDEVPLPLPKPLQTLTHPSLLTTLPHNPSYPSATLSQTPTPCKTFTSILRYPQTLA